MTDDIETPAPPADWARQLLAFWFEGHGMDDWYGGGPDFDAANEVLADDLAREGLSGLRVETVQLGELRHRATSEA